MMLGLLLLQVLASCLWLGHSEVVTSFAECPQFFYAGTFPNDVLHPQTRAWICQHYSNSYHYATLYDRDGRIPVYSAYLYEPEPDYEPHPEWFVEPQLISKNDLKDMENESVLIEEYDFTFEQIKQSQAVTEDYNPVIEFERGQLNPSGHHYSEDSKTATFTLTNTVPLYRSLYRGPWKSYETTTMREKSEGCDSTYVITGAVPGRSFIADGRVNVPSHIWSAACCLVGTQPGRAWGAIAENDKNQVEVLSLGELEARLSKIYRKEMVILFNNACPRQ